MKEYKIICNMYESKGGLFKYAISPSKVLLDFTYKRSERENFITKCKYLLKEDMFYDDVKMYFIDYDNLYVVEIKDIIDLENVI